MIVMRSLNGFSGSGFRTKAVTVCPRSIAWATTSSPVAPVAPSISSFIGLIDRDGGCFVTSLIVIDQNRRRPRPRKAFPAIKRIYRLRRNEHALISAEEPVDETTSRG